MTDFNDGDPDDFERGLYGPDMVDWQPCANTAQHAITPASYLDHMAWVDRMQETHVQLKCEGCGGWDIWVPKDQAAKTTRPQSSGSEADRA